MPTADNCGWCQEGHPVVKTMPTLYDDDVMRETPGNAEGTAPGVYIP